MKDFLEDVVYNFVNLTEGAQMIIVLGAIASLIAFVLLAPETSAAIGTSVLVFVRLVLAGGCLLFGCGGGPI